MSVAATLTSEEGSPTHSFTGSWTVFSKKNTDIATCKSETEFLPVVTQAPKDNVCKYYLDFLLDMKNDQKLNYIFCHSDQDAFLKLSEIIWKETKNTKVS